jgi:hypothetical protein
MRIANYGIAKQDDKVIVLQDLGPWSSFPTITNSAEEVVAALAPVLDGRRLYYYDSDGDLTELEYKDGVFTGFGFPEEVL